MSPGDELALRGDLRVRAVRTFHPVPSLGYVLVRRVAKLQPELAGLPGPEIAARRRARRGRHRRTRIGSSSPTRPTRWSRCSITRPSC